MEGLLNVRSLGTLQRNSIGTMMLVQTSTRREMTGTKYAATKKVLVEEPSMGSYTK